jgi:hypothetical protein
VEHPHVAERLRRKLDVPFMFLSDYRCQLADALGVPTLRSHPFALTRLARRGVTMPAVFIFDRSGARRFTWLQEVKLRFVYGPMRGRLKVDGVLTKLREIASR